LNEFKLPELQSFCEIRDLHLYPWTDWDFLSTRGTAASASGTLVTVPLRLETVFVLHQNSVMKNVTITMDEEVARWARIKAAEQDTSISRLVGEMLREKMMNERSYHLSMRRYLSRKPRRLSKPGTSYPKREEIHER
jgi:hypothetical protein